MEWYHLGEPRGRAEKVVVHDDAFVVHTTECKIHYDRSWAAGADSFLALVPDGVEVVREDRP
mgnify:CR=1 FL=1